MSRLKNAPPSTTVLTPQTPQLKQPSKHSSSESFHTVFTERGLCSCLLLSAFIFGGGGLFALLTRCFVESRNVFFFSSAKKQKHPPFSSYLWQTRIIDVLENLTSLLAHSSKSRHNVDSFWTDRHLCLHISSWFKAWCAEQYTSCVISYCWAPCL